MPAALMSGAAAYATAVGVGGTGGTEGATLVVTKDHVAVRYMCIWVAWSHSLVAQHRATSAPVFPAKVLHAGFRV
jgi:hypothetical protein